MADAQETDAARGLASRSAWWLRVELANPGGLAIFAPVVAVALALLSQSVAWRTLDGPLLDIVARRLAVPPETSPVIVVDVGRWDASDVALRAAVRRDMARLLDLLAGRPDVVVGIDALLDSRTMPDADRELAEAVARAPQAVVLARETGVAIPRDSPMPAGAARGLADVDHDPDRVVRFYPATRPAGDSLARAMVVAATSGARPSSGSILLHGLERDATPVVVPIASVLEQPHFLENLPSGGLLLVGLTGVAGLEVDSKVVTTAAGPREVPGVFLHAHAARLLAAGTTVRRAGPFGVVLAVGAFLAAFVGATRGLDRLAVRAGRRAMPARDTTLAVIAGLAGLPAATLAADVLGVVVSPLSLVAAPVALVLAGQSGSWMARRIGWLLRSRPLVGHAPAPLAQSLQSAFLEAEPLSRLSRLLDAYEDLLHYTVTCRLALVPLTYKQENEVRNAWHSQHTLQTVLATLRAVDGQTHAEVQELSRLRRTPEARAVLRRCLRFRWRSLETGLIEDFTAATSRDKYLNWFILLRNALAHDTAAWIDPRTAAQACAALGGELRGVLRLAGVSCYLRGYRLEATAAPTGGVVPALVPVAGGGEAVRVHPWLTFPPTGVEGGPDLLFRYRGLADRFDWPEKDGKTVRMVSYTEFGRARRGLPERLLLPLGEVVDAMPERLRLEVTA